MIILREKTYAFIPDLFKYGKNSGIKRIWQKNIGETRRKLGDAALRQARKNEAKLKQALSAATKKSAELSNNIEDFNKLASHVRGKNIDIVEGKTFLGETVPTGAGITSGDGPKDALNIVRKGFRSGRLKPKNLTAKDFGDLKKLAEVQDKSGLIVVNQAPPSILAHEFGHNLNRLNNNKYYKRRSKSRKGGVIGNALRNRAILKEEVEASKRGLKEMEIVLGRKATEAEKASLNIAADTYKYGGKRSTWENVANKVNIPSRTNKGRKKFANRTVQEQRATVERSSRPDKILPEVKYEPSRFIK